MDGAGLTLSAIAIATVLIVFTIALEAQTITKVIRDGQRRYFEDRKDDPAVKALNRIERHIWAMDHNMRGGDMKEFDKALWESEMDERREEEEIRKMMLEGRPN